MDCKEQNEIHENMKSEEKQMKKNIKQNEQMKKIEGK